MNTAQNFLGYFMSGEAAWRHWLSEEKPVGQAKSFAPPPFPADNPKPLSKEEKLRIIKEGTLF